jgi:tRNA(Ile)-lysidine synthase
MNDQAETFLLNLIRGSGPEGLSGMSAVRTLERAGPGGRPFRTKLIRPLLNWAKRRDTEDLCALLGVEYRYDTMNEDLAFTRVRIRKLLLPMLKDFNPNIVETLARTAALMRPPAAGGDAAAGDGTLAVKGLIEMPETERETAVRSWLKGVRGGLRSIDRRNLEAIVRLAVSTKSGRMVELPGGGRVTKQGGRLAFENIKVDK